MKKMLSTTLVAIAFAMVSTVDAKVMRRAGTAKPTTMAQEVRETTQEVVMNPTQKNVSEAVDMLANDKAGIAIAEKKAKELEVANQRTLVTSLGKKGLIWDSRTEEEKQAHKNASEKLAKLEQELKDIKADNETVKKEVGINYYNAMTGTFVAVLAAATISVLDDILLKGQGKEYIKTSRVGEAAGNVWEGAKTRASTLKEAAMNKYYGTAGK